MALEKWEIDLRNQLEKISAIKEEVKKEEVKKEVKSYLFAKNDLFFYLSMISFFVLSGVFIIDFKTDFINKILNTKAKQTLNEKIEPVIDNVGKDLSKINDIETKIRSQEEKLFILAILANENNFIIKNGLSKKNILLLNKDWKLTKYPSYINFSESDKKYLDKIQEN